MQSPWHTVTRPWICRQCLNSTRRSASLTSAISRGIRRSNRAVDRRLENSDETVKRRDTKHDGIIQEKGERLERPTLKNGAMSQRSNRWSPTTNLDTAQQSRSRLAPGSASNDKKPNKANKVPLSIPYTTSASEFLYGTFAVLAAIKARRRKLYKLYILRSEEDTTERTGEVEQLARYYRIKFQFVGQEWANILSKMADNRPHNGVVLEASPLPKQPVRALEEVKDVSDDIRVRLDHMSAEEEEIAGSSPEIPRQVSTDRYPLILLLDRILDPGNLGAIIRSAYFLGVDAVVMSRSGTAPASPVMVKASAGAAEAIPLLTANAPLDFVKKSRAAGWRIFSAVSPSSESGKFRKEKFIPARDALVKGPCVLVIGGEGEGIARSIMKETDGYVGIPQASRHDGLNIVESLNVSVATALMVQQLVGEPLASSQYTSRDTDDKAAKPVNSEQKIF